MIKKIHIRNGQRAFDITPNSSRIWYEFDCTQPNEIRVYEECSGNGNKRLIAVFQQYDYAIIEYQ